MAMSTSGADNWLQLKDKPLRFQTSSEHFDPEIVECNSSTMNGYILVATPSAPPPHTIKVFADGQQLRTTHHGFWEWRPPLGFAGLSELQVEASGYPIQIAKIRVFPEKLSQDRYNCMISDISAIATDLLIRLNSSVTEKAILDLWEQKMSPLREFELIRIIMKDLEYIMFHIRRSPHQVLKKHYQQTSLQSINHFSDERFALPGRVITLPSNLQAQSDHRNLPEFWMVQENTLTYDVYENQLLKHFIQNQLIARASFIYQQAENEIQRSDINLKIAVAKNYHTDISKLIIEIEKLKLVLAECKRMIQQCVSWTDEAFLKSIKSPSILGKATQVLLKHPFYSRFFQLYLNFQQELKISLDITQYLTYLSMQKVCDIYEAWSIFTVTKIVLDKLTSNDYTITSSTLFYEIERDRFQFNVQKNKASIVLAKGHLKLEIKYEPVYKTLLDPSVLAYSVLGVDPNEPSEQLTPDLSIEIYDNEQPIDIIIFDAKYKWNKKSYGYAPDKNDRNKMREYRDDICYKKLLPDGRQVLQKVVSNAYILYPGDVFIHPPTNNTGAIPLVPDMDSLMRLKIENAVEDILKLSNLL